MGQVLFLILFLGQMMPTFSFASTQLSLSQPRAVYGIDDRKFIDHRSSKKVLELSDSIAMIISKDVVQKHLFSSTILTQKISDKEGIGLCLDEKFANHHSVNSCSGFLIGEDLVASAGHCFKTESDCAGKLIVFNVLEKNETSRGYKVSSRQIFECSEIVTTGFESEQFIDYSIIRLKTKVAGKKILKLRSQGQVGLSDKVFMIGHPLGLPQIITKNVSVSDVDHPRAFKAKLDSFEGNSGSPVFNANTFEVEGILVRGEEDFLQDPALQCYRNQVYEEGLGGQSALKSEGITRISEIIPFIKSL